MRINVYAEELPSDRRVEVAETTAENGRTFVGARIFLKSAKELHDDEGDDDRSAITFWGPRKRVAALLREAADAIDDAGKFKDAVESDISDDLLNQLISCSFYAYNFLVQAPQHWAKNEPWIKKVLFELYDIQKARRIRARGHEVRS